MEVEHTAARWLTEHRDSLSAATVQRKLAAFRKFGKFMGWPAFLEEYKAPKRSTGVAHPIEQGVDGVLDMITESRKPAHAALISLCGLAGLRVGEALKVRPSHIDEKNMVLTVFGKGSKMRKVPLSDRCYEALLPRLLPCWADDGLLVPLDNRTARRAVTSVAKRCGMQVASHDLRMTFGTATYHQSGGNIRVVQELLGHASSTTTENYTQVRFDEMRQATEIVKEEG